MDGDRGQLETVHQANTADALLCAIRALGNSTSRYTPTPPHIVCAMRWYLLHRVAEMPSMRTVRVRCASGVPCAMNGRPVMSQHGPKRRCGGAPERAQAGWWQSPVGVGVPVSALAAGAGSRGFACWPCAFALVLGYPQSPSLPFLSPPLPAETFSPKVSRRTAALAARVTAAPRPSQGTSPIGRCRRHDLQRRPGPRE